MVKRQPFLFGFLVCLLIIAARAFSRVLKADLWAEDADIYIADALIHSWKSLVIPHGGSFHLIQRIISFFVVHFIAVSEWPRAIAIVTLLIFVGTVSQVCRTGYRWLIPSDAHRVWLAVLLSLSPGLNEILGNLPNLNWVLFYWVGLISLRDDRLKKWEMFGIAAVLASIGTSLLLLPVFVWRAKVRPKDRALVIITALLIVGMNLGLAALWVLPVDLGDSFWGESPRHTVGITAFSQWPKAIANSFLASVFYRPWFGAGFSTKLVHGVPHPAISLVVVGLLSTTMVYFLLKNAGLRRCAGVLTLLGGVSLWPVLAMIARPWAQSTFCDLVNTFWGSRYAFPLGVSALLFWFVLLYPSSSRISGRSIRLFVLLSLVHGLDRFPVRAYRRMEPQDDPARHWEIGAPSLERALRSKSETDVTLPVYPGFKRMKVLAVSSASRWSLSKSHP